MKIGLGSLVLMICALNATLSSAAPKDTQGRLFAGGTSVSPANVNEEVRANGLKKISATLLVGLEATYPIAPSLDLGLRYIKNQVDRDEDPSDPLSSDKIYISQDLLMGIARVPLVKSNFFRFDIFGGWGAAMSSTLKLEAGTQKGELSKRPFESMISAYGASVSIGYKSFFLFVEAGGMSNSVGGFQKTGTMNDNIQRMDLSGPYALVGVNFTGMPSGGSSKK